jgi:hypothetical protein
MRSEQFESVSAAQLGVNPVALEAARAVLSLGAFDRVMRDAEQSNCGADDLYILSVVACSIATVYRHAAKQPAVA